MNLPPVLSLGFPRSAPKFLPLAKAESPKRGEYITVFREAKQVLRTGIAGIVDRRAGEMRTPVRHSFSARACKLPRHPSLASSMVRFICAIRLTNFFDLSNIRVEPWGAGEMLGASRWSRKMPFQFDGQPALGADLLFACHLSTPPKNVLQFPRERRLPAWVCAELRSFCGVTQDGDFRAARL